jgi:hypothetical protein
VDPLNNLPNFPAFVLAQGARFNNYNAIADLAAVIVVMRLIFGRSFNVFVIYRVLDQTVHLNHHGLIHFIADYHPGLGFPVTALTHI